MSVEKQSETLIKKESNFAVDLDTCKFAGLWVIATGQVPSKERFDYLSKFVRLSIEQGSGGFDEKADVVAGEEPRHSKMVKVYWGEEQVKKYRNLLDDADRIYSKEEARRIKQEMAKWYNTFHYEESTIRGVTPPVKEKDQFKSDADNPAVRHRETINKAYVNVMTEILSPATSEEQQEKNDKILNRVIYPASMIYQVATDFAQSGLECQISKLTLDKTIKDDLEGKSTLEQIVILTKEASKQIHYYAQQLDFPKHITNFRLRAKVTQAVAWLGYVQELTKYQVFHSKTERYPQVV